MIADPPFKARDVFHDGRQTSDDEHQAILDVAGREQHLNEVTKR